MKNYHLKEILALYVTSWNNTFLIKVFLLQCRKNLKKDDYRYSMSFPYDETMPFFKN
jgi:hypothetical protein